MIPISSTPQIIHARFLCFVIIRHRWNSTHWGLVMIYDDKDQGIVGSSNGLVPLLRPRLTKISGDLCIYLALEIIYTQGLYMYRYS